MRWTIQIWVLLHVNMSFFDRIDLPRQPGFRRLITYVANLKAFQSKAALVALFLATLRGSGGTQFIIFRRTRHVECPCNRLCRWHLVVLCFACMTETSLLQMCRSHCSTPYSLTALAADRVLMMIDLCDLMVERQMTGSPGSRSGEGRPVVPEGLSTHVKE
jgi:hypothetical protein